MRKYRILHLITRLELGGAQQNTLHCTRNHDRTRFVPALVAGRGGFLDDEALGIADAEVELVRYLEHQIAPLSDLVSLLRLTAMFRRGRYDLVHTHSSKAGILGRLAGLLAGVPVIIHTVHGWSFNETQAAWRRKLYVVLERIAARFTDRLVVVSSINRDDGLAEGIGRHEQYAVVHSGIDLEEFSRPQRSREEVRRELGVAPEQVLVGTVACFKQQKAPLDFVRAAASLAGRDDLRFVMAGDGELREQAASLAAELGIADRISFLGWRTDVIDLHHAFDIFLLTSLFEGLPRVVLQSMAAGVPVVATAVDGTPEVVEDGVTGLLVPPGRPDAAAEAVLKLAADRSLGERLAGAASARLGREFDIDGMVAELDRIYLTLLEPIS